MDKQLLDALNNLSLSLEKVAETLINKSEMKSPVGTALASGDFSKSLANISESISKLEIDTKKILGNQNTILNILESKKSVEGTKVNSIKPVPSIIKPTAPSLTPIDGSSMKPTVTTSIVKPATPVSSSPIIPSITPTPSVTPDGEVKKKGIFSGILDFFKPKPVVSPVEKPAVTTSIIKPVTPVGSGPIIPSITPTKPITPIGSLKPTVTTSIKPVNNVDNMSRPSVETVSKVDDKKGVFSRLLDFLKPKPTVTTSIIKPTTPSVTPPDGEVKKKGIFSGIFDFLKPKPVVNPVEKPTVTTSIVKPVTQFGSGPSITPPDGEVKKKGIFSGIFDFLKPKPVDNPVVKPTVTTSIKPINNVDNMSRPSVETMSKGNEKKDIISRFIDLLKPFIKTNTPSDTTSVTPPDVETKKKGIFSGIFDFLKPKPVTPVTTSIIKPVTTFGSSPIIPSIVPTKPVGVTPINSSTLKPTVTTSIIKPVTPVVSGPIIPSITPTKPAVPSLISSIRPAVTTSIVRPPTFTPASPIVPVGPIVPASPIVPVGPIRPAVTTSIFRPPTFTPVTPIAPFRPIISPIAPSSPPIGPVRPAVTTSIVRPPTTPPGSPPGMNPSPRGGWSGLPVIPVAIVSFGDGSELLGSSSAATVIGRRKAAKGQADLKDSKAKSTDVKKPVDAKDMSRPSVETVSKEGEEKKKKGLFSDDQKKAIGDGVKLLLLMAVGIVAIGLAFKIVGSINVASVLALAVALPLVAIAFEKISKVKTTPREMLMVSLSLVIMAGAILLSSFILSKVKPIGLAQAFSTIVIAGAFAIISTQIGKLIGALGNIKPTTALIAALLMPIVLVAVSYAIMKSSEFIRNVKPIGFQQAFSTIVIAATFAIISISLGRLIGAFGGISPITALVAAALMPIVLIGVSYAIMKSSEFIRGVKPIGFQQAFSSIVIAGVFALVGFGIGKLLKAFGGINPVQAIAFAIIAPIILIGISYAIMKSSEFIRNVKPVGFQQFFASAVIALVFVILSFGIKQIVKALDNVSLVDIVKASIFAPIILIAMSYAIMESSQFIRLVKPIGIQQFFASIMISVIFVAMSFAAKFIVKNTKGITARDMVKGALVLVAMAVGILAASLLIKLIPNISNSQMGSFIKLSLVLISLAVIALAITKITKNISQRDMIKAALVIVALAITIALTSQILSMGDYSKFPSVTWVLATAFTIAVFGLLAGGIGFLINKIGVQNMAMGAAAIVILGAVIALTSQILSMGDYSKYPTAGWILGVGISLVLFGAATLAIGSMIMLTAGLGAAAMAIGAGAVLGLAATIVATDKILSSGSYTTFPPNDWIGSVAKSLLLFGTAVITLGALSAGGGLLEGITFGLVKNPIDAGMDAVRKIAGIIAETSSILAGGDYGTFPTNDWISGVAKTLILFGTAVVTLGAISSGGGALEGITFGLVKNPIKAGIDAIKDISQSIVDADTILSSGSYTGGPKVEWSKGIGLALGSFSSVYKMMMGSQILSLFTGGRVGGETFTASIKSISEAIKLSSDILSTGTFTGGPKEEWAKSVGIAIGAFSQVYDMIEKAQVLSFFSRGNLGVSVQAFSAAITSISTGIATAATTLGGVKFEGGPNEAWAKGIGLAIGAFSEVYSMLQKQKVMDLGGKIVGKIGKLFGGSGKAVELGVSVSSFSSAIGVIAGGLKVAAIELAKGETSWKGGPTETWAKGVGQAISAFAPVFKAVSETTSLFGAGPSIGEFKDAIVTISKGIIDAAGVFGEASKNAVFDLSKVPSAEWGQNVGQAIGAFSPVFQYLSENSGWFSDAGEAADKLKYAIKAIAASIKDSSITLFTGKYDYEIDSKWGKSISMIYKQFIDIFNNKDLDTDADDIEEKNTAVLAIARSIKSVSVALASGSYNIKFFEFEKSATKLISSFIGLFDKLPDLKDAKAKFATLLDLSRNIKQVSDILSVGKYGTKFLGYEKSSTSLISSFVKLLDKSDIEASKFPTMLSLARNIRDVSKIISSGKYDVSIPKDYMSSFEKAIDSVTSIIKKVKSISDKDINKVYLLPDKLQKMSFNLSKIKFAKIPDKWIDSTFKTLSKFADLIKLISGKSNLSDSKKIENLTISMLKIDKMLAFGKYKSYPPTTWIDNVSKTIMKYGSLIMSVSKSFTTGGLLQGAFKISTIIKNIVDVSNKISSGKYSKYPGISWIKATELLVNRFGALSMSVDKKYGLSSLNSGLLKILNISKTISSISGYLSAGKYTSFPSLAWASGVPKALQGFMNLKFNTSIMDYLFPKDEKAEKNKISKVIDLMLFVDSKFKSGNWTKFPTLSWANGTIAALSKFSNILKLLDFKNLGSGLGKNTGVISAIGNIDLLTKAFDRLGIAINRFTKSVDVIDAKKLESIRTLTSNVVLLSLMDPNQFETMMSKLESKSQVFSGLINDSKAKSAPAASGSVRSSGVVSMSTVKTSKASAASSRGDDEQSKMDMNRLVAIMADIASVVGSKGTLNEYLENVSAKQDKEAGSWF